MSKTVTLPKSGGTVVLRDGSDVKHKDRKNLILSMDNDQISDMVKGLGVQDRLICLAIKSWSGVKDPDTGEELPSPYLHPEALDELSVEDIDFLTSECAEFRTKLFPDFDVKKDPDSPTPPSAD